MSDSVTHDAIIIGGGLAGLSAAVDLASHGQRVVLVEQKPRLGGRAWSFIHAPTGDVVDNGQHLMMGCYHATIRYLRLIGSQHLASLQPNLHIEFLHPSRGFASLRCPPLPAPLHVLVGLLRLRTVPFSHRLRLLRIGSELLGASKEKEAELESRTVDEWLSSLDQTEENRKYLWDILAVGTLNDDPRTVSALLFYRVLKAAFLGARRHSSLLVPTVGLSELLVDPAQKFLESKGCEIITGKGVESVQIRNGFVESVKAGRRKLKARAYVGALPYHDVPSLFPRASESPVSADRLREFKPSPIITIHLWMDRQVIEHEFVATLDSTVQWIFNKTKIYRSEHGARQYLSLLISGAAPYVTWSSEKLVAMATRELKNLLPAAREAKVLHALVLKEKRATFSPKPGIDRFRPSTGTSLRNFFLAGDWTDTGYPATIEGAVISGFKASEAVRKGLGGL